jgi:hypothetical protein
VPRAAGALARVLSVRSSDTLGSSIGSFMSKANSGASSMTGIAYCRQRQRQACVAVAFAQADTRKHGCCDVERRETGRERARDSDLKACETIAGRSVLTRADYNAMEG